MLARLILALGTLAIGALAIGELAIAASVSAQPRLQVRAETRIELRTHRGVEGEIQVRGVLRDDLGAPLSRRAVHVRVAETDGATVADATRMTDAQGAFGLRTVLRPGTYRMSAQFGGDASYAEIAVERGLDLARAEVHLVVRVRDAGRFDLDTPEHAIDVQVSCDVGTDGLDVELLDELDRPLARATADDDGSLSFVLSSSGLGAEGPGRMKARTRGDARRADAQTEVPIIRYRATEITLDAEARELEVGDELALTGSLRNSQGPLREAAIGIYDDDAHRATVLTDDTGRFLWRFEATRDDVPTTRFHAVFESDNPGRIGSESAHVSIAIDPGASWRWLWLLAPMFVCMLVVLWIRRRRPHAAPAPPVRRDPVGISIAPTAHRRASSRRVRGWILGHADGDPLGASIEIRGPETRRIDAPDGAFDLELPNGTWTLRFVASHHAPVESTIAVPHQGEWEGIRVRLETWRARIARAFLDLSRRFVKPSTKTIHELRHDERLPTRVLRLGKVVEEGVYGPVPPSEDVVRAVEREAK